MFLGLTVAAACATSVPAAHGWSAGDFRVTPVVAGLPSNSRVRADRLRLIRINRLKALTLVKGELPQARYYYLTSALFWGWEGEAKSLPEGVALGVDVDLSGVAYLTSGRLGTATGTSSAPVILSSNIPLKGIVPVCEGAI